jgi:phosphonatase-like hydrolase
MGIELVVFDLAGTTVKDNFDVHKVLRRALAKHGVTVSDEDANDVMGIPKPVAIKTLLLKRYTGPNDISGEWITQIHHDFVEGMVEFYRDNPFVEERKGTTETFIRLKNLGIKIFVDTGFDRKIADVILDRLGWLSNKLIDGSVTSDEVFFGRPYPDMIYKAMELAGVSDSQRVAKVGDTTSDLEEGLNAGCKHVIGITTGAHSREKLSNFFHTHLINNIDEVVSIVSAKSELVNR